MAEKVLFKVGGVGGAGTFEVVSVNGVAELRVDGVAIDTTPASGIAGLTAIATADGSDAGTTQTLANACKAKINAIIAALQT